MHAAASVEGCQLETADCNSGSSQDIAPCETSADLDFTFSIEDLQLGSEDTGEDR